MTSNIREERKLQSYIKKLKRQYNINPDYTIWQCKSLGVEPQDNIDDIVAAVVSAAKQLSVSIPPTLFHKIRTKDNFIKILKTNALKTGLENVVSFSKLPLPTCERRGFAIIEVKTPIDACMVPVSYTPYPDTKPLINIYHLERTIVLRETQKSCESIKFDDVVERNYEGAAYLSESEVSALLLDGRGRKCAGTIEVTTTNIVSIFPECRFSKAMLIKILEENKLDEFISFVKEPLSEEVLKNIIYEAYKERSKVSGEYKRLEQYWQNK